MNIDISTARKMHCAFAYARKAFILILTFFPTISAMAETSQFDCGFSIDLAPEIVFKKDADVGEPLCTYRGISERPTPFVNSITTLHWNKLDALQVNGQPLHDIGFFRLYKNHTMKYLGRSSYTDTRHSYGQKVLKRLTQASETYDQASTKLIMRSELKVSWLKSIDEYTQEEATDYFSCIDAVVSNITTIAIMNWCIPKDNATSSALIKAAESLRLENQGK